MKAALAFLALAALVAAQGSAAPVARAETAQPNIVVVMTDDQTVESMRVMENVQRLLVARGTSFENSFASLSLCCPSRATFLTGQYAHNHGVLGNAAPAGGYEMFDGTSTLPVWLQQAGYYTAHVGRYLNGYGRANPTEVPPGWSEWHGAVDPSSYQYYRYTLNEDGKLRVYGSGAASYQTDVYARKAVEIVRRRAAAEHPFFLSVAFLAPHAGGPYEGDRPRPTALPARRHRGRFAAEALPVPPSFNEADVSDKPRLIRRLPLLGAKQIADITAGYRLELESLLAVDEAVAAIVEELRRSGELSRTLILFTSDNGFFHGEHRIPLGKSKLYEPSVRVPLVLRGPGVPQGARLRQPVVNADLAPTILEAAGAQPGQRLDGRSLLPLLRDRGLWWGRDILLEGPGNGPAKRAFVALRTPRYVYAERLTGEVELYDLARDPYQLSSLHANPALAEVRVDLARRLTRLRDCAGSRCREGPPIVARLRVQGGCPGAVAEVGLTDDGTGYVTRADFLLNGSWAAADRKAPFRVVLPLPTRPSPLRVHALLFDGRKVTKDRMLPACR
jgi:arylsulfatase A-like enzyme